MLIFLFAIIALTYAYFLYRVDFRYISLFWVMAFSISFLLPVIINNPFKYGVLMDYSGYEKLNLYYFIALISFLLANIIFHVFKFKFKEKKLDILSIKNTSKIFNVYALLTILVVLMTGVGVVSSGTVGSLDHHPLMKIFSASVLFGLLYISLLRIYLSENNSQRIRYIMISLVVLLIVAILVFGRRILIYPLIAIFILMIFKKGRAPNVFLVSLIGIFTIGIILPMMMSIRTLGIKSGVANFFEILTGNFTNYVNYLAYGTDVNYSYSFAAIILSTDTRVSILTLFKPIFSLIPRFIWESKPQPLSEALIEQMHLPFKQGMSIPPGFVGESYAYLGIIGVIVASVIFGIACGLADSYCLHLRKTKDGLKSVKLVMIVIIATQMIMGSIRGDTATNIQEAFYLFLPLIIFIKLSYYRIKI
ncbi:O-antigen polymerase [Staphylococcus durrellii]|uniref:O-antigen polymerase n=1 Tax=Staphylococcus durrellii TaxID=2781773 RepID=UPI0018A0D216|nr:O-antigen polymerase [Staphylococcus durrellii]MBF7017998.1 oligosaccharide repeat unit polymerase [Staphylococcus durrellii]